MKAATDDRADGPPGPWVLVVGMHRSGTSALTGALGALGLRLPPPGDLVAGMPDNPVHYESGSLIDEGDALLDRMGGRWDAPPRLDPGWASSEPARAGDRGAAAALARVFPGPGPNLWKDPRHCLLLPYWRRLLDGPVVAVLTWRSPGAVARSLEERDGSPRALGLALWEQYNREALAGLDGLPTYVLPNRSLLDDPAGACSDLAGWLTAQGVAPAGGAGWDVGAAAGVVDPALDHDPEPDVTDLLPEQVALAERLASLGGPHARMGAGVPGSLSPWSAVLLADRRRAHLELRTETTIHRELSEAHRTLIGEHRDLIRSLDEQSERAGELQYRIDGLRIEVVELQQELQARARERDEWQRLANRVGDELERVRASTSWKVTAPLRALGDASRHGPHEGSSAPGGAGDRPQ